jgi:hypothetical protein
MESGAGRRPGALVDAPLTRAKLAERCDRALREMGIGNTTGRRPALLRAPHGGRAQSRSWGAAPHLGTRFARAQSSAVVGRALSRHAPRDASEAACAASAGFEYRGPGRRSGITALRRRRLGPCWTASSRVLAALAAVAAHPGAAPWPCRWVRILAGHVSAEAAHAGLWLGSGLRPLLRSRPAPRRTARARVLGISLVQSARRRLMREMRTFRERPTWERPTDHFPHPDATPAPGGHHAPGRHRCRERGGARRLRRPRSDARASEKDHAERALSTETPDPRERVCGKAATGGGFIRSPRRWWPWASLRLPGACCYRAPAAGSWTAPASCSTKACSPGRKPIFTACSGASPGWSRSCWALRRWPRSPSASGRPAPASA